MGAAAATLATISSRPTEPAMSLDEDLHAADFHAWTLDQAERLRALAATRSNLPIDAVHLAEELEALGSEQRAAVRSQLRRIVEHLLKLRHSPAQAPRAGWQHTIVAARAELADRLTATLRRDLEEHLDELCADGAEMARKALEAHGETEAAGSIPAGRPFTLDEILRRGWYPAPRGAAGTDTTT
jgi:hypothetical protein